MTEMQAWESAIDAQGRVLILEETTSTQDAAVEYHLQAGDVCGALHQTDGRGRRGKKWDATGGVAVTVVLPTCSSSISIATAAVLATQLNALVPLSKIGIKWPNDLLVDGRKFAGLLIEQHDGRCFVGVGVNVLCMPTMSGVYATNLASHGYSGVRATVAAIIVRSIFEAVHLDPAVAVSAWRQRDVLIGTHQSIITQGRVTEGIVLDIDPCSHLILETTQGTVTLSAATSSIQ